MDTCLIIDCGRCRHLQRRDPFAALSAARRRRFPAHPCESRLAWELSHRCLRMTHLFFEFSQCLSRVCLGKIMSFSIQCCPKRRCSSPLPLLASGSSVDNARLQKRKNHRGQACHEAFAPTHQTPCRESAFPLNFFYV